MPQAFRNDKQAEKIAWKVLGTPPNIAAKRTERERKIDARLNYEVIVGGR
jgi:hypothetical protein